MSLFLKEKSRRSEGLSLPTLLSPIKTRRDCHPSPLNNRARYKRNLDDPKSHRPRSPRRHSPHPQIHPRSRCPHIRRIPLPCLQATRPTARSASQSDSQLRGDALVDRRYSTCSAARWKTKLIGYVLPFVTPSEKRI